MPNIKDYQIVIAEKATYNERRAASFIRNATRLVTGATLPIVSDASAKKEREIVIGNTTRELDDKMEFTRSRKSLWEFVARFCGERLYLTGLGLPAEEENPYKHPYATVDDGAFGTSLAAYRFVEDVLGYDFLYDAFSPLPEVSEIEIPLTFAIDHYKEALMQDHAPELLGPAVWMVPSAAIPNWNMGCMIFRSREGRIVLIDGGFADDTPRIIRLLQEITGQEKPVIDALLFTHLHGDHYGFIKRLATDEELQGKVEIKAFYHHLLEEEFYTTLSKEAKPEWKGPLDCIYSIPETLGTPLISVKRGDVISIDDLHFHVLHVPDMETFSESNMNDSSVIYRLDHESGQRFLLLGDAEWRVSNALTAMDPEELRAEVVQVGHHGVGNVSRECYRRIGGKVFLYPISPRFWYSDRGEGLGSHVIGMARNLSWLLEDGAKKENIHSSAYGIVALPLPIPEQ